MLDLKERPFYLDDSKIEKVYEVFKNMTEEEKIGQIFCPIGTSFDEKQIEQFIEKYKPGAMMYRPLESIKVKEIHENIQRISKIPLLLAANLESGGIGICEDGTYYGRQMEIAASNNEDNAYKLGSICGKEANAVGCNWSFAPIVDIDLNYRNPITNVRTYGDNIDRIINMASKQIEGLKENDVIPCIKHFPGDGVDDRDQHLLSSVNDLSVVEWDNSYGKIYKSFINQDVETIMIGHILLPKYVKAINPDIKDEDILPSSMSKEVITGLLREKLGFNGLVVTDATPMIGYNVAMKRKEALCTTIENGCDMLLFNKDIDEDYQSIKDGLSNGLLSKTRLDEAVLRILATKAKADLFEKVECKNDISVVGCLEHKEMARRCADESITLVKDTQNLLPIGPERYKRVRLYNLCDNNTGGFKESGGPLDFINKLEAVGFQVEEYDYEHLNFKEIFETGTQYLKDKYDLVIYLANYDTASNNTVRRIEWIKLMAADAPWFINEIPTMFISLANPYHLLDVPMVKTYINCYTPTNEILDSLVKKLIGEEEFTGINPIDPFCKRWDTRR